MITYRYHYDWANSQWNVFKSVNGNQEYVCSFNEVGEAKEFCRKANEELAQVTAEA